jgi:hypothetical protein
VFASYNHPKATPDLQKLPGRAVHLLSIRFAAAARKSNFLQPRVHCEQGSSIWRIMQSEYPARSKVHFKVERVGVAREAPVILASPVGGNVGGS